MDEQTTVMAEGRRMMRLSRELSREHFQALLDEYQRLLTGLFEGRGGLGDLALRDLGEQQTRRTELAVRAFELVVPPATRW